MRRLRISRIGKAGSFSGSHKKGKIILQGQTRDRIKRPFHQSRAVGIICRGASGSCGILLVHCFGKFFPWPGRQMVACGKFAHLIKSVKPVTMAMKRPRWLLRLLFGKPQAASRRFAQIQATTVLRNWRDTDLDKYFLPHPLLGKLTIREMLFFTLYHDRHHVNNVRKLLDN